MRTSNGVTWVTVVGFVVGVGILLVLLAVVGVGDVLTAVSTLDPSLLVALLCVAVLWMATWSGSLYLTSRTFGVNITPLDSFLVYVHMMFLDNVVPFSSISADPFAALAVATATDSEYETSLATVITVDFLNFVPAPVFGIVGLVYLFVGGSVDETMRPLTLSLVALLVGLSIAGYLGWRYRYRIGAVGAKIVATTSRAGNFFPHVSPLSESDVDRRLEDMITHLETMASDRRTLLAVLALAASGWGLLAATLWLSLYAVGHEIPVSLALFLVPLVTVLELLPLPGGMGGYESAFVALLVALGGISPPPATAGILVHRGTTYWLPVVLGGSVIPFIFRRWENHDADG